MLYDNIFNRYHDKLLVSKYNHFKCKNNHTLILPIKIIHEKILIEKRKLILDNLLGIYNIYENNISKNGTKNIVIWIHDNTNILEDFIDQNMKSCINTTRYR